MRLSSQNKKRKIIIAVIVTVVVLALVAVGTIIFFNNDINNDGFEEKKPDSITTIEISSKPLKTIYHVGEEFNSEGIKVQVITNYMDESYFVDASQLYFSGFDSSSPVENQVITVSYKEFTTTFTITVKEFVTASPVLTSIRMGDGFQTTYTKDYWNMFGPKINTATLILVYSDGSEKEVGMNSNFISGVNDVELGGKTSFTVTYEDAGIVISTVVTVTITE